MNWQLHPDAPDHPENAAYLGRACQFAYLPEPAALPLFARELGLDARLVASGNTQAYVGASPTAVVVAFRGSESPEAMDGFKDWLLTNASNFLLLPEGQAGTDFAAAGVGARFHRGFLLALDAVWGPLRGLVESAMGQAERPLWVTGHSLGGALALLAAWRFGRSFYPPCGVITFGAPMIGNGAAAQAFEREYPGKIIRYVDELDVVPLLPCVALLANDYCHCPAEQRLGGRTAGPDAPAEAMLQSLGASVARAMLDATTIDNIWGGLKRRIAHHMMTSYLARLDERRTPSA